MYPGWTPNWAVLESEARGEKNGGWGRWAEAGTSWKRARGRASASRKKLRQVEDCRQGKGGECQSRVGENEEG